MQLLDSEFPSYSIIQVEIFMTHVTFELVSKTFWKKKENKINKWIKAGRWVRVGGGSSGFSLHLLPVMQTVGKRHREEEEFIRPLILPNMSDREYHCSLEPVLICSRGNMLKIWTNPISLTEDKPPNGDKESLIQTIRRFSTSKFVSRSFVLSRNCINNDASVLLHALRCRPADRTTSEFIEFMRTPENQTYFGCFGTCELLQKFHVFNFLFSQTFLNDLWNLQTSSLAAGALATDSGISTANTPKRPPSSPSSHRVTAAAFARNAGFI